MTHLLRRHLHKKNHDVKLQLKSPFSRNTGENKRNTSWLQFWTVTTHYIFHVFAKKIVCFGDSMLSLRTRPLCTVATYECRLGLNELSETIRNWPPDKWNCYLGKMWAKAVLDQVVSRRLSCLITATDCFVHGCNLWVMIAAPTAVLTPDVDWSQRSVNSLLSHATAAAVTLSTDCHKHWGVKEERVGISEKEE